jgi:hypothetical protein
MSNAREEGTRDVPAARNSEERVAQVLETSRQAVKDLVRRELETESINSDLLNLRLRA